MPLNNQNQQPQSTGLSQFRQQPQGQPGQKPGKPGKPVDPGENVNAGVLLADPGQYDINADTAAFTGWTDVTPHVAGGGIQIVGGVRQPVAVEGDAAAVGEPQAEGAEPVVEEGGLAEAAKKLVVNNPNQEEA